MYSFGKQHESEAGTTMVEYALMLSLIALTCVFGVGFVGDRAGFVFQENAQTFARASGGIPTGSGGIAGSGGIGSGGVGGIAGIGNTGGGSGSLPPPPPPPQN